MFFAKIHITPKITLNPLMIILTVGLALFGRIESILSFVPALIVHELGHIIAARSCGLCINELEITPFGARAAIENLSLVSSSKEILCGAMGPFSNMVFAGGLIALQRVTTSEYMSALLIANLSIAAINMLPALPLDGGRIMRSILTKRISINSATNFLCGAGIFFGTVLLILGVYSTYLQLTNLTFYVMGGFLVLTALNEIKKQGICCAVAVFKKEGDTFAQSIYAGKRYSCIAKPPDKSSDS